MKKIILVFIFICMISIVKADLNTTGLINYYAFEENSGEAKDNYGNINTTNTGSLINKTDCKRGNCRYFGGDGDRLIQDSAIAMDTGDPISFNLWFKGPTPNVDGAFFGLDVGTAPDWDAYYETSGNFNIYLARTGGDTGLRYTTPVTGPFNNTWNMMTFTHDGSCVPPGGFMIYLNGQELSGSKSPVWGSGCGSALALDPFNIGVRKDDGSVPFLGNMDEFSIWNITLSPNTVNKLFNNHDGEFLTLPPPESMINLSLLNSSNDSINYQTSITEDTEFFIGANYTFNNSFLNGGYCNFTAVNISSHFTESSPIDVVLDSAGDSVSIEVEEELNDNTQDRYQFAVCSNHVTLSRDLEVYINSTLIDTVSSSIIPSCSSGSHFESNVITSANNFTFFSLILQCPSCIPAISLSILNDELDRADEILHYNRRFNLHYENLTEDPVNQIYKYDGHLHKYEFSGADQGNINITCNGTTDNFLFEILDVPLDIQIIAINNLSFINNTQVEAAGSYNITIDISGDVFQDLSFNVTNSSGFVLGSTDEEIISVNNTLIDKNGKYDIHISVFDDEGFETVRSESFFVNDTVTPVINWIYPASDNSSEGVVNVTSQLNFNAFDINLFGYNMTAISPSGAFFINATVTGLTSDIISFDNNITFNESGEWEIRLEVVDSHTSKLIPEFDVKKTSNSLTYDDIKITGLNAVDTHTVKLTDRYTYDFFYDSNLKEDKVYILESNNTLDYVEGSGYKAHFVDFKARKWIDFEGIDGEPLIYKESDNKYRITFQNVGSQKISFNSIGGLNSMEEHKIITVLTTAPVPSLYNPDLISSANWFNHDVVEPTSIQGVLLYFFLLLIIIVLYFFAEHFAVPAVMIFAGLMSFFYGFLIYATISAIFGSLIIVFSCGYFLRAIFASRA